MTDNLSGWDRFVRTPAKHDCRDFHESHEGQCPFVSSAFTILKVRAHRTRCFLAVKHASAAMLQTSAAHGKEVSGGSIILTASSAL